MKAWATALSNRSSREYCANSSLLKGLIRSHANIEEENSGAEDKYEACQKTWNGSDTPLIAPEQTDVSSIWRHFQLIKAQIALWIIKWHSE